MIRLARNRAPTLGDLGAKYGDSVTHACGQIAAVSRNRLAA
jgi:hypothetical protein